jgi:hypothetical protein
MISSCFKGALIVSEHLLNKVFGGVNEFIELPLLFIIKAAVAAAAKLISAVKKRMNACSIFSGCCRKSSMEHKF